MYKSRILKKTGQKLRSRKGAVSLIETVVTLLLVVLMSGMMVTGIRLAVKVYTTVVDKANAQVLLTTTEKILRNELSSAKKITVQDDKKAVSYQNNVTGQKYTLSSPDADILKTKDGKTEKNRLIAETTGTKNLHINFEAIELSDDKRYITVSGLTVTKGTQTLAGPEDYLIGVQKPN